VHKRGKHLSSIESGKSSLKNLSVINSGMMIKVDAFIRAGGYNEKMPLDLSDHQFIEQYKQQERFFWVLDTEILQDFSNEETNIDALYSRFRIYVNTIKNCERTGIMDSIDYFILAFGRTMKMTLRTRQIQFVKYFITAYLCNYKK
jgi:hypothetical protein